MPQIFLVMLFLCVSEVPAAWKFGQNSFELVYERAVLAGFSKEYFEDVVIKTFKHNRTQAATNGTFLIKKDCSPNANVKIQVEAYKFHSNEYRGFPILFSYDFCECLKHDDFGFGGFLKCGNLTVSNCSIQKGTRHVCNFFPNAKKFPPHIPEGSYKVDIKWFIGPKKILFLQGHGTIKNKLLWDRK